MDNIKRRKVSPNLPFSGNVSGAKKEEPVQTKSLAGRYTNPEKEFSNWKQILLMVQEEFVKKAKLLGGSASAREDETFYTLVSESVSRRFPEVSPGDMPRLVDLLKVHLFGYGAIQDYMDYPGLEELYFNRYDQGFIIAGGRKMRIQEKIFSSPEQMRAFLDRVAAENGLEINLQKPILDAALSDGSRLNASIEPIAVDGADFIIRKHRDIPFSLDDFIKQGVFSEELAKDLKSWVSGGMNIIVSGGTASGKTSFLNTIGKEFIPASDRVLILENRKELQIATSDCKYFQTREDATRPGSGSNDITLDVLVRATLRKRPRRIIVGEVRGKEAYDALEAWNTGHEGSMCTIHANSAAEAVGRLESLASRAGVIDAVGIRRLIAGAVDIIIQLQLEENTGKRRVSEVIQVLHDHKYPTYDPAIVGYVEKLKESMLWRDLREEISAVTLYEQRGSDHAEKLAVALPIYGRGNKE